MTRRMLEINVPALARVEGEGALELRVEEGHITDLRLRIYEPPRYFEKFLEGRSHQDVIDSVARICGICPVAYQMSAVQAIESIFGIVPTQWVRDMRRVMYCGEWLQSHSLHVHMLAAPDFLGCSSVIEMAREHDTEVRRGLRLQELGNDLIALFGGRSVHPVGVCAGGFFKAPSLAKVGELVRRLEGAWEETGDLIRWTASLHFPEHEQDFVSVAMRHDDEYAINSGRIVSDRGLDLAIEDYQTRFAEHQEPHSTALHALLDGKPYLVGPLARINLNLDRLPAKVTAPLADVGVEFPSRNMFHSIVARALEIRLAIHEALHLLRGYALPHEAHSPVQAKPGVGYGCTEAPRGMLWHRYELDENGHVMLANIVPPTSQNQARIEQDLRRSIEAFGLDQPEPELRLHAETVIRNYDPCISCSTHFLSLEISETGPEKRTEHARIKHQPPTSRPLKLIAVGSPLGSDAVAWRVLEHLQQESALAQSLGRRVEWRYLDRPGSALLKEFRGDFDVVLLDALISSDEPGQLRELVVDAPGSVENALMLSGHAIGLQQTLQLAMQLGELPGRIHLLGLCVEDGAPDASAGSAFVETLLTRTRQWLLQEFQ